MLSPEDARVHRGPAGMLDWHVDVVLPAESSVDWSATCPEGKHVQTPRLLDENQMQIILQPRTQKITVLAIFKSAYLTNPPIIICILPVLRRV